MTHSISECFDKFFVIDGVSVPHHPGEIHPHWEATARSRGVTIVARVVDRLHVALRCDLCGGLWVSRVSVVLGYHPQCPHCLDDARPPTQALLADLERELSTMMAGRAAERLVLGDVSAGAGGDATSDLAQATRLAAAIDAQFGLGETGPVWQSGDDLLLLRFPQLFSRARARVEAAEAQALEMLRPHVGSLRALAARLVVDRELTGEELRQALFLPAAPSHETKGAPEGEETDAWP